MLKQVCFWSALTMATVTMADSANHWLAASTFNQQSLYSSSNGEAWQVVNGTNMPLLSFVRHYKNQWIGFGNGGNIYNSDDGITWNLVLQTPQLYSFAPDHYNRIIAIGKKGVVYSAIEGINWHREHALNLPFNFNSIDYGPVSLDKGAWIAVGDKGIIGQTFDGIAWSILPNSTTSNSLHQITHGLLNHQNLWVAVGDKGTIITSTDLKTWVQSQVPPNIGNLNSVAFGKDLLNNPLWVAVGDQGVILASSNGKVWTLQNNSQGNANLSSVQYSNGQWVMTGDNGTIMISFDGNTWADRSIITGPNLIAAASDQKNPTPIPGNTVAVVNDTICIHNCSGFSRTGNPARVFVFNNLSQYAGISVEPNFRVASAPVGVTTNISPPMPAIYFGTDKSQATMMYTPIQYPVLYVYTENCGYYGFGVWGGSDPCSGK